MTAARTTFDWRWPTRAELRWAGIAAAVVMALTCVPYLVGLLIRPDGWYYSGLLANPDEHNVYLAYMRQAHDGAWFILDPFTSEDQLGRVINLFFLLLGRLARVAHLPLAIAYHLARLVAGWLLLVSIYCLGAQLLPTVGGRRIALLLAALASGFGWAYRATPGAPHPIDYGPGLVMPEAITFLSLLLSPLFSLSVFLMIVTLAFGAYAMARGSARAAVPAGLAALFLGNIHSYDLVPVGATLGAYGIYLLARRRLTARGVLLAATIAIIAAPSVLYQLWLLRAGELTLVVKMAGEPVSSPPPLFMALGFGLPLALAAAGLARAFRRDGSDVARLLAIWLVLGFALLYLPSPFQRKLAQGLYVPICLLAALGLSPLWSARDKRGRAAAAVLLIALVLPSNLMFVARGIRDLRTNNAAYLTNGMPPLYLRPDQHEALMQLDRSASMEDLLLCNSFLGSYAPSVAGVRVYLGHWDETLDFAEKQRHLATFLRADTPEEAREDFCRRNRVTHVLRDRSEYDDVYLSPQRRPGYDPDGSAWLSRVQEEGRVTLYRVEEG